MREYSKIYDHLKMQIFDNYYAAGQKLPPERQLCEQFDVSRITARHALRLLEDDGLVERFQGKGTFVKSSKPSKLPITDAGFAKSVKDYAPGLYRKLIKNEFAAAPEEIAETLGIDGKNCLIAIRTDILNKQAIAFDKAYIIREYSGQISEDFLVKIDFFEKWIAIENLNISHCNELIEAISADKEISEILDINKGLPILKATEIYFDSTNKPVAVFESYYQGDKIKLNSTVNYKDRSNARISNS